VHAEKWLEACAIEAMAPFLDELAKTRLVQYCLPASEQMVDNHDLVLAYGTTTSLLTYAECGMRN
jgi:hypothetical protein